MADIVQFPRSTKDGGRERIERQRRKRFAKEPVSDLVMLHADSEIVEPPSDCA